MIRVPYKFMSHHALNYQKKVSKEIITIEKQKNKLKM